MAGTEQGAPDAGADEVPEIVQTDGVIGGDPRIEGTRIGVYHVYRRHVDGDETPESIAAGYDISLSSVHAALAYAFANPGEMREIEAENRAAFENPSDRLSPEDLE